MRILRIVLAALLFVACVFLATANMHGVMLVLPDVPVAGWPQMREVQVPLFVVVLAALVIGVVITGLGTLFEQLRLRGAARRARKECRRAEAARDTAEQERDTLARECQTARAEVAHLQAEAADLRVELDKARTDLQREREVRAASVPPAPGARRDPVA